MEFITSRQAIEFSDPRLAKNAKKKKKNFFFL